MWVDDWQMQCCGKPFRRGGTVSWNLTVDVHPEFLEVYIGTELARQVDRREDHHGDFGAASATFGTVTRIRAVHCRYESRSPTSREMLAVPGSGVLVDVDDADGWFHAPEGNDFAGYLVDIDVV